MSLLLWVFLFSLFLVQVDLICSFFVSSDEVFLDGGYQTCWRGDPNRANDPLSALCILMNGYNFFGLILHSKKMGKMKLMFICLFSDFFWLNLEDLFIIHLGLVQGSPQ